MEPHKDNNKKWSMRINFNHVWPNSSPPENTSKEQEDIAEAIAAALLEAALMDILAETETEYLEELDQQVQGDSHPQALEWIMAAWHKYQN